MTFGSNLARVRTAARLTQQQLGEQLGITGSAVSQWERGETVPELEKIPDIARACRTTPNQLFDGYNKLDETDRAILDMLGTALPRQKREMLRVLRAFLIDSD